MRRLLLGRNLAISRSRADNLLGAGGYCCIAAGQIDKSFLCCNNIGVKVVILSAFGATSLAAALLLFAESIAHAHTQCDSLAVGIHLHHLDFINVTRFNRFAWIFH